MGEDAIQGLLEKNLEINEVELVHSCIGQEHWVDMKNMLWIACPMSFSSSGVTEQDRSHTSNRKTMRGHCHVLERHASFACRGMACWQLSSA